MIREWEEQSRSAPTPTSLKLWQKTNNGVAINKVQQQSLPEEGPLQEKLRLANSLDMGDLTEDNVANITISNESLPKSGESFVVKGKGMGSTVKVKIDKKSKVKVFGLVYEI